ncbi:hypothetical protein ANN_01240 [Periplaneta americana]|uniref:Uncharacterized protein n=1 Tax=Periplaneta americana TaxID=6978 RepID=A0ABQ8TT45_PERAM|nr:hypothetical protein ANN_01240 [Periplaneta americana]
MCQLKCVSSDGGYKIFQVLNIRHRSNGGDSILNIRDTRMAELNEDGQRLLASRYSRNSRKFVGTLTYETYLDVLNEPFFLDERAKPSHCCHPTREQLYLCIVLIPLARRIHIPPADYTKETGVICTFTFVQETEVLRTCTFVQEKAEYEDGRCQPRQWRTTEVFIATKLMGYDDRDWINLAQSLCEGGDEPPSSLKAGVFGSRNDIDGGGGGGGGGDACDCIGASV